MLLKLIFIKFFLLFTVVNSNCPDLETHANFKFYLIKSQQRSINERLFVDNVDSLEACKVLARKHKGLAFNYASKETFTKPDKIRDSKIFRDHYWHQPHLYFNCHILQCPENGTYKTVINDTLFDYYSLYKNPIVVSEYTCLPEIGLFILQTTPESFQNASVKCRNLKENCGSLAHVASQKRTESLTALIAIFNEQQTFQVNPRVSLAYVGLQYNSSVGHNLEFFNEEKENLKCFTYRAWEAGNPKLSWEFNNASCVALTTNRSWKAVKCERKLPFICEIWTSCGI